MSNDLPICNLCLEGERDTSTFKSDKEADVLIRPCSTCSITTHKNCLLDWFNSLPSDKLKVRDSNTISSISDHEMSGSYSGEYFGVGQPTEGANIRINISSQFLTQWISNFANNLHQSVTSGNINAINENESQYIILLAPCPQCKNDILFHMKKSFLLTLISSTRTSLVRVIQYGGVFLGFTSALTGIASMSYVGLTTMSLRILDCLIPGPLLVKMLARKPKANVGSTYNSLMLLILGNLDGNSSVENIEQALSRGLIDPFKFSRIPVLPIVLYRMRLSSIVSCLLESRKELFLNNWFSEFMINGYISSWGNHELFKTIKEETLMFIKHLLRNPSDISNAFKNFKKIDFWNFDILISLLVPLRWAYDFFFRLTFNRLHFNELLKVKNSVINGLDPIELNQIEHLDSALSDIQHCFKKYSQVCDNNIEKEYRNEKHVPFVTASLKYLKKKASFYRLCLSSGLFLKFVRMRAVLGLQLSKICLKNDYSTVLLQESIIIRGLTTFVWPLISSKVGMILYRYIISHKFSHVPKEKVILLSNILGMVFVVFLKDCFNLYITRRKLKQLTQMSVYCLNNKESNELREASVVTSLASLN